MKSMLRAISALCLLALAWITPPAEAQVTEGYVGTMTVATTWSDTIVTYPAMASTTAFVHNIGTSRVVVFFTASGSAPAAGGIVLKPGDTLTGSAAHVWVRSIDATGFVTLGKAADASLGRVPSSDASTGTAINATSVASSGVVFKVTPGTLFGVNVTAAATAGYVMIFNSTTIPADGTVTPSRCIPLAANTGLELNYRPIPIYFGTGIAVAFSSTGCFTKTASATAFITADVK